MLLADWLNVRLSAYVSLRIPSLQQVFYLMMGGWVSREEFKAIVLEFDNEVSTGEALQCIIWKKMQHSVAASLRSKICIF